METSILLAELPPALERAIELLREGQMVAFPTDTVYGLGALAFDREAIERIYLVKGRDATRPISVLVGSPAALAEVTAGMNALARALAEKFWPGALTLVVPRHPALPDNLSAQRTIGVRMPDHPVALALLKQAGPLTGTSANLSGQPSASTAQEVYVQLSGRIPLILDGGRTPGGAPSTVVDCTGGQPVILRPGPITREQIFSAFS